MICYTLSDCILENIGDQPSILYTDLLSVFINRHSKHKLAIDSQGKILDIYLSFKSMLVEAWLQQMAFTPSNWERINIDIPHSQHLSKYEIFKLVCSQTADKLLIVYSHNGWTKNEYTHERCINYRDHELRILDRDEAIGLLCLQENDALHKITPSKATTQSININNGIIVKGDVSNSPLKNKIK